MRYGLAVKSCLLGSEDGIFLRCLTLRVALQVMEHDKAPKDVVHPSWVGSVSRQSFITDQCHDTQLQNLPVLFPFLFYPFSLKDDSKVCIIEGARSEEHAVNDTFLVLLHKQGRVGEEFLQSEHDRFWKIS